MKSFTVSKVNGVNGIDSFSLYVALDVGRIKDYSRWAKNLDKYGDEGIDFFKQKTMIFDPQPVRLRLRYHVSLLFACELCASVKTAHARSLKYELRRVMNTPAK